MNLEPPGIWNQDTKGREVGSSKDHYESADFWGLMVNGSCLHVTERVENIGSHREGDRTAE